MTEVLHSFRVGPAIFVRNHDTRLEFGYRFRPGSLSILEDELSFVRWKVLTLELVFDVPIAELG